MNNLAQTPVRDFDSEDPPRFGEWVRVGDAGSGAGPASAKNASKYLSIAAALLVTAAAAGGWAVLSHKPPATPTKATPHHSHSGKHGGVAGQGQGDSDPDKPLKLDMNSNMNPNATRLDIKHRNHPSRPARMDNGPGVATSSDEDTHSGDKADQPLPVTHHKQSRRPEQLQKPVKQVKAIKSVARIPAAPSRILKTSGKPVGRGKATERRPASTDRNSKTVTPVPIDGQRDKSNNIVQLPRPNNLGVDKKLKTPEGKTNGTTESGPKKTESIHTGTTDSTSGTPPGTQGAKVPKS